MNQSYTREQLRTLPNKMREDFLEQTIQPYLQQVLAAAQNGQNSVMLSDKKRNDLGCISYLHPWMKTPTNDEIREALLKKFPDCTITYEEKWVDISAGKRELKKGLTVDWS